jgi:dipeptide/tripeptide permease
MPGLQYVSVIQPETLYSSHVRMWLFGMLVSAIIKRQLSAQTVVPGPDVDRQPPNKPIIR